MAWIIKNVVRKINLFLVIFLIFSSFLYADIKVSQNPKDWQLNVLNAIDTFTQKEIPFTFYISDKFIDTFEADLPELPLGVRFLSSEKKFHNVNSDGEQIYEITYWFSFSDAGEIKLPPLTVTVGSRIYYIPFQKITVYENPALLSPILSFELKNKENTTDFYAEEEIQFDVFVQYCVQILNFSHKIPKSAIFEELSREEITKSDYRKTEYTTQKFKLASYKWIPLESGEIAIPDVAIDAIAYNGDRKRVSTLDLNKTINILPSRIGKKNADIKNLFESAFLEIEEENKEVQQKQVWTDLSLKNLQKLRQKERRGLPFSQIVKERKAFEEKYGIMDGENEPTILLLLISSIIAFFMILIHIIMVIKKKVRSSVIFAIFFVLLVVFAINENIKVNKKYAISVGGKVYKVPEDNNKSDSVSRVLPKGFRVRIVENIENWVYIECSEISGWVKSDSILLIE